MRLNSFDIQIASPPDCDQLVAMILFGNEQWAELNQESQRLALEIYPRQDGKPWVFELDEALKALSIAKERLVGTGTGTSQR